MGDGALTSAAFELDGSEWGVTVSAYASSDSIDADAIVVRPARDVALQVVDEPPLGWRVELVNLGARPIPVFGLYEADVEGIVVRLEDGDARTYGLPGPGCGFGRGTFDLLPGHSVPMRFATGVLGDGVHEARYRTDSPAPNVIFEARVTFERSTGDIWDAGEEWGEMAFTEPTLHLRRETTDPG